MNREQLLIEAMERLLAYVKQAPQKRGSGGYELTNGRTEPGPSKINRRKWAKRVVGSIRMGSED